MKDLFSYQLKEDEGSCLYESVVDSDGSAQYYEGLFASKADIYFDILKNSIAWEERKINFYGKVSRLPRLTAWFSNAGKSYSYSGISQKGQPFPSVIEEISQAITETTDLVFNSVLLNLYRNGEDKVFWHSDDEACLGSHVNIASVSFGAARDFQMRHKFTKQPVQISLEHGSLLTMRDPMQKFWEHQIPVRKRVVQSRINLTFRNIE